jgi:hypothetical protein
MKRKIQNLILLWELLLLGWCRPPWHEPEGQPHGLCAEDSLHLPRLKVASNYYLSCPGIPVLYPLKEWISLENHLSPRLKDSLIRTMEGEDALPQVVPLSLSSSFHPGKVHPILEGN